MVELARGPVKAPHFGQGTRQCWRVARYVTPRLVDVALRVRTAAGLPISRGRFEAMGLPDDAIEAILRHVTSLDSWEIAWTWGAQRFLGESRRHATARRAREAALARQHAALCFHAATIGATSDEKTLRTLRAARTTLFSQALPILMPTVRRVDIVWRATLLPGFLALPTAAPTPLPLVVILNGSTTAKEETLLWAGPLLAQGVAILCLDWPGTGESGLDQPLTLDCDDLTDGIIALAREEPALSPDLIALVGFSLGGVVALRAAAAEPRLAAVVAVSAPYDPAAWLAAASPLTREHLHALAGPDTSLEALAAAVSLVDVVPAVGCPMLVVGAGADLLLPPAESLRLAAAGDQATLLWYPDEGHGLYDAVDDWTAEVGRWVRAACDLESTSVDHAPRRSAAAIVTGQASPAPITATATQERGAPDRRATGPRGVAPLDAAPPAPARARQTAGEPLSPSIGAPSGETPAAPSRAVEPPAPPPATRDSSLTASAAIPDTPPDVPTTAADDELEPPEALAMPRSRRRTLQVPVITASPIGDTFSPLTVDAATFWDAMARGVVDTSDEAPTASPQNAPTPTPDSPAPDPDPARPQADSPAPPAPDIRR